MRRKPQSDARRAEWSYALIIRSVHDIGDLFFDFVEIGFNDSFDALQRLAVFDVDVADGKGEFARHVYERPYIRIVDDFYVPASIFYLRGANAYFFDCATESVYHYNVANVEHFFKHDKQSRDDVGNKGLRAETYNKAQYSGSG